VDATEPELATMVTNSEEQADEPDDTAEEQESPNVEAAKWRKQFLEAETQLAEMGQRVQALQRQQIEGLINQAGVKPAAVWAVAELGTLVGEDGTVDAAAVSAAIDNARTQLGIQPIGKGVCVPSVGGQPSALPQTDAWENAFAPRKRQNDGARQTPSPGDRWPAPFFPPGADTARCQP
jgi:hypothetical protein